MIKRLFILAIILAWALWKLLAMGVPVVMWVGASLYLLITKLALSTASITLSLLELSPMVWNAVTAFCVAVALAIALIRHSRAGTTSIMVGQQFLDTKRTEGVGVAIVRFRVR